MTKPTKIALGLLGILIVGAIMISSMSKTPLAFQKPQTDTLGGTPSNLPVLAQELPAFVGISHWWNTPDNQPLTPEKLKGKVVLIDFWTYSCINCIRTYPFLRQMHERYADKGLVIIGVHTPEFAFEKEAANVEREIKKNDLRYPIALDPEYGTWNAYGNHYWPAEYFFDRQGRLRRTHFGEGEYEESEASIRALLAEAPVDLGSDEPTIATPDFSEIQTPETYFGLSRGDAFLGTAKREPTTYTAATKIPANTWTAEGTWRFEDEFAEAQSSDARFLFNIQAMKFHVVLESSDGKDKQVEIFVDGKKTGEITVNASTLYTVAEFPGGGRHTVELRLRDGGVRFYAATFS
jgi:thiol-disulfide isomerase/thioredoxin